MFGHFYHVLVKDASMKCLEGHLNSHFQPLLVPPVGRHRNEKLLLFVSSLQEGGPPRVYLVDNHKGVRVFDVEYGWVLCLILVLRCTPGFPPPFLQQLYELGLPRKHGACQVHHEG